MQKTWGVVVVVAVLAIIGFGIYFSLKGSGSRTNDNKSSSTSETKSDDTIVDGAIATLYYGKGCPHCVKVEQWLSDNKIADKIKYNVKEVWYNQTNSAELSDKAQICNISSDKVGVPFLYDIKNNKCYSGETDVENFFTSQTK